MFHTAAHKNVAAPAAQVAQQTLWMNVYRAGWFHRAGKPFNVDIHAGDFYTSREAAQADVDPPSHYLGTVPFEFSGPVWHANPADSIPTSLAASRRMHAAIAEAQAAGRPFSTLH